MPTDAQVIGLIAAILYSGPDFNGDLEESVKIAGRLLRLSVLETLTGPDADAGSIAKGGQ